MIRTFILSILKIQLLFLGLMTLFRAVFYFLFTPYPSLSHALYGDLAEAFWFGLRLDLSALGYVNMLAVLILLAAFLGRLEANRIRQILQGYLFFIGVLLSAMASTDMAFYSYFGDHANIMIFGVFDDDTSALLEIARKNYNLPLLLTGAIIYTLLLWLAITSLLPKKEPSKQRIHRPLSREYTLFLILILFSFLAGRGTFGHFPLYNDPIDASGDPFVNILPQNGVYALVKSYKFYKESKEEK